MTLHDRHEAGNEMMCMGMATQMMCRCFAMRNFNKRLPCPDIASSCYS